MTKNTDVSTENTILEVAELIFLDKGYAKTSTTEIARVAGCNQALVHYYYRSKENLFRLIFERKAKMFFTSFLQIKDEDIPFEEKLKKRIEVHFDMVKANKKLPVLLFNELSTNMDMAKKLFENIGYLPLTIRSQIQSELDEEYKKGTIRQTDAKTLLFNIFSLNVMTFISFPLLTLMVNGSEAQLEKLLEERKNDIINTILNSLRS